jgi:hypothetical protein
MHGSQLWPRFPPKTHNGQMIKALVAALLLAAATAAAGDPVKCVDAKGKVTYMDETAPGADKCQPVAGSTQIVPHDTPSRTPTARPDTSLEEKRARIAAAETQLNDARQKLAEQEAIREGNERNYARVLERLKPYQEAVDAAEKNLERAKAER